MKNETGARVGWEHQFFSIKNILSTIHLFAFFSKLLQRIHLIFCHGIFSFLFHNPKTRRQAEGHVNDLKHFFNVRRTHIVVINFLKPTHTCRCHGTFPMKLRSQEMLDNMLKVRVEQEKGEKWTESHQRKTAVKKFCTVDDFRCKWWTLRRNIDVRFRQTNFWGHKNLMCQKRNL